MSFVKRQGVRRRRAARIPGILETLAGDGIGDTVKEVRAKGADNIRAMTSRRTGAMLRFYRSSVSLTGLITGRVGYITERARRSVFYARFIHDGTRSIEAQPFHDLAVEDTELPHRARMRAAQQSALRSATTL